jgi:hypothetical protein
MPGTLILKEIEGLGYDFMGYMGVPFFNIGGAVSMDRLAELCHMTENTARSRSSVLSGICCHGGEERQDAGMLR